MRNRERRHAGGTALFAEFAFAPGGTGALTAELLRRIGGTAGPVLWAQDWPSRRENGRPCWAGVRRITGRPVIHVAVSRPVDVLRVMEEGASCQDLAAVIGEIHGAPKALDFVATKRLKLRAEASGVPVLLVRSENTGLSAARERWRVSALPSGAHPDDAAAPGRPRWRLELLRAPDGRTGAWIAGHDGAESAGTPDHRALVAGSGDGALATGGGAAAGEAS
jgi:protein ImuA